MAIEYETFKKDGFKYALIKLSEELDELLATKVDDDAQATETMLGLIKLNPLQSISVDADGKLIVGGRLGQFPDGGGIYYGADREPRAVGAYALLVTDALGMEMNSNRALAVVSGVGLAVKGKHNAGVTQYQIANTYNNRIRAMGVQYLALDEATSTIKKIVPVVSCTIDGQAFTPSSAPDDSTKNIVITVEESINPDSAIASGASIRCFGSLNGYGSLYIGSGVGAGTGGANLVLGQAAYSKTGNMNVITGQYQYNQGNGNTLLGRWHVSMKNRWLLAGSGHDNTNGISEAGAALGAYSDIKNNTLFAIGNGTSHVARSNAFEILSDGRVKASGTPSEADDLVTKGYADANYGGGGGGISITTYGNADFTYEQVIDPDTQTVINECIPYSTSAGNANEPKAIKYGRMVNLCGAYKNINARPDTTIFVMGKVPVGCEPLYTQNVLMQGTSQNKWLLTIETDGTMKCSRYSTGASAAAVPNNAWLNINTTYVSAS